MPIKLFQSSGNQHKNDQDQLLFILNVIYPLPLQITKEKTVLGYRRNEEFKMKHKDTHSYETAQNEVFQRFKINFRNNVSGKNFQDQNNLF
jgi:hypothetical protein